jgi:hypothetical protein
LTCSFCVFFCFFVGAARTLQELRKGRNSPKRPLTHANFNHARRYEIRAAAYRRGTAIRREGVRRKSNPALRMPPWIARKLALASLDLSSRIRMRIRALARLAMTMTEAASLAAMTRGRGGPA